MDVSGLKAGDDHYMAYVGPPEQYDFMGATQFRLLCSLGLRSHHSLLDFGCGSLRAGRLFLGYLDQGRYFGIEPNKWLIEDVVANEIGEEQVALKKPRFDHNSEFRTDVFSERFDFIIAQSIFSHTGRQLISTALRNFSETLKPDGLIVATFVEGFSDFDGTGWVYPGVVNYRKSTIRGLAEEARLSAMRLPWYHPRQTWYVLARDRRRLPARAMLRHLSGAVLSGSEFIGSWKRSRKIKVAVLRYLKHYLPRPIRNLLKKLLVKTVDQ